jgi:hypothetical protein
MYFAIVKITFEHESGDPNPDRRDVAALVEKLRARFRITVMAYANTQEDGETAIAYTSLALSEESLTKQMDSIAEFCEESGFGRIADEAILMDHIDSIGEDEE